MKTSKLILMSSLVMTLLTSSAYSYQGNEGSGGGNALEGKLIQSMKLEPLEVAEISKELNPILDNLKIKVPGVHSMVMDLYNNLTFYVVPVKHETLSRKMTGLPFKSDQPAIQYENDVWISEEKFKELKDPREKAKLILHEVLESLFVNNTREGFRDLEDMFHAGEVELKARDKGMALVRNSTEYLFTDALKKTERELANELKEKQGWTNRNMPWAHKQCHLYSYLTYKGKGLTHFTDGCHLEGFEFNLETKTEETERLQKEMAESEEALKNLRESYPIYKKQIFEVVSHLKNFCSKTESIFSSHDELIYATNADERATLISEYKTLSKALGPYLAKAKLMNYSEMSANGIDPVQVKKQTYKEGVAKLFKDGFTVLDDREEGGYRQESIFWAISKIEANLKETPEWHKTSIQQVYNSKRDRYENTTMYTILALNIVYTRVNFCDKNVYGNKLNEFNQKIENQIK